MNACMENALKKNIYKVYKYMNLLQKPYPETKDVGSEYIRMLN